MVLSTVKKEKLMKKIVNLTDSTMKYAFFESVEANVLSVQRMQL